jgi:hypothetical protein
MQTYHYDDTKSHPAHFLLRGKYSIIFTSFLVIVGQNPTAVVFLASPIGRTFFIYIIKKRRQL